MPELVTSHCAQIGPIDEVDIMFPTDGNAVSWPDSAISDQ